MLKEPSVSERGDNVGSLIWNLSLLAT